jgi:Caudovirus prohead serine protease
MEHLTKTATVTTTDLGEFTAVISTEAVDRERDVVVATAMVAALHAWSLTGKTIPLAWNHSSDPEDIVGHVEPESVKAVAGEVVASGWVDQTTERGAQVWRLMKSGILGFSFGYLITNSVERADGVREIRGLDVFEVSATPTPMNGATRVLSTKSLIDHDPLVDAINEAFAKADAAHQAAQLKARSMRIARENAPIQIASFEC